MQNWEGEDVSGLNSGWRTIQLSRPLNTGDIFDIQFAVGGIYPVCAVYNLELGYNTSDCNAEQPSHTKVLCGEIALS